MDSNWSNPTPFSAGQLDQNGSGKDRGPGWWAMNQPTEETPEPSLAERLYHLVRKRKWIVIQAVVIVVAIVGALTASQTKSYAVKASLLFQDQPPALTGISSGQPDPNRESKTVMRLVELPVVADLTSKSLKGRISSSDIQSAISVSSDGDSNLVDITASSDSAQKATTIANAYGLAYIDFRRNSDRSQVQTAINVIQKQLAGMTPTQLAGSQGTQLKKQLRSLQLDQAVRTGQAELVQPARSNDATSSPSVKQNVLLAGLLGLLLGLGLAALVDRLDTRVKNIDELEDLYGLPVVGAIPRSRTLTKSSGRSPGEILSDTLGHTVEGEAFRTLRANLRYFNVDDRIRSILVASTLASEGKSTVARFLAVTMAAMGDRVCLVEADLHKQADEDSLADAPSEGLSLVLAGFDLDDALTEVPIAVDVITEEPRTLTVLPSGPPPPNPSELLESTRMKMVVRELEERFDVVIIDTPPLAQVADGLALVPEVSGVIVVCGIGKTNRRAVLGLRKRLAMAGGRPLGVVANFWTTGSGGGYNYGYAGQRPRRSLPARTSA